MSDTNFDPKAAATFLVAVRAGAPNEVAASHAGVPLELARLWLDDTEDEDCLAFESAVTRARADLEILAVGTVRRIATGPEPDLSAAKWLAERVHGDAELERLRRLTT